ncbi:unnamed protein product, partial [Ectocarpus sp. 6 AP-2014]
NNLIWSTTQLYCPVTLCEPLHAVTTIYYTAVAIARDTPITRLHAKCQRVMYEPFRFYTNGSSSPFQHSTPQTGRKINTRVGTRHLPLHPLYRHTHPVCSPFPFEQPALRCMLLWMMAV